MLEIFKINLRAFSLQAFQKETPTQVLSCEVWETFKNTYFDENLQTAASENVFVKLTKIVTYS